MKSQKVITISFMKAASLFVAVFLFAMPKDCIGSDPTYSIDSLKREMGKVAEKSKPEILLQIGIEYAYIDSFEPGLKYLMQSLQEAGKLQQNEIVTSAQYYLGDLYLHFDDIIKAQQYFLEAYRRSTSSRNYKILVFSAAGLGSVYIDSGDWELARRYLHTALRIAKKKGFKNEIPKLMNLLGILYSNIEQHDSAEYYFSGIIDMGKARKDSSLIGFAYINIADMRMKKGRYQEAISLLKQAMLISSIKKDIKTYAILLSNLGESYGKSGKTDKALRYLNESNKIAMRNGYLSIMSNNYKNLSDTYKILKNYESSLENMRLYMLYNDSILNNEKQKQLQITQSRNQLEQIERKLIERKQKDKARIMIMVSSLIISILLVVIVIQSYRRFRLRTLFLEMEKARMIDVIDQKNRDLVSLSMNLEQKKSFISKVKDSIQEIKKQKGQNTRKFISEIHSDLITDTYIDHNWASFIKHFNAMNPDFFRKLQLLHPNISKSDMKHCAYIKLNLSSKDVAALNNVNMSSVQMARYRLKKKLGINKTEDLFKYLGTIG